MKKLLGKRQHKEETKASTNQQRTIKRMMAELNGTRGSPHEMAKLSEMLMHRANDSVDQGYIKTLLFPELYNADIPQPMSTQSYCRFTDKREIAINSGGEGMLVWYPKVNVGPSIFIKIGDTTVTRPFQVGTGSGDWKASGFQDYTPYFGMTNLVAGSLSIQYVGQLQNEQGYMVASQLYGIDPDALSSDEVENGQFRSMAKPGDGMRTTYIPKDLNDYTYAPCSRYSTVMTKTLAETAGTTVITKTRNGGAVSQTDNPILMFPAWTSSTNLDAGQAYFLNGVWPKPKPNIITYTDTDTAKTIKGGMGQFEYSRNTDFVCIYWKGLAVPQQGTSDLRIDIVRKFNGFPQASVRDFLDLNKPKKVFDPKKTIDVIQELQSAIPNVVTHSLKQMDRVSDQIQEFLPNLGHLYNEGLLKEGTSLEGFAQQLQQISGTEGAGTLAPVRLYDS